MFETTVRSHEADGANVRLTQTVVVQGAVLGLVPNFVVVENSDLLVPALFDFETDVISDSMPVVLFVVISCKIY